MLLKTANSAGWAFYPFSFGDAVIEMNARVVSGSGDIEYGVVLRMSRDGNNGYVFSVTNNAEYEAFLYSSVLVNQMLHIGFDINRAKARSFCPQRPA